MTYQVKLEMFEGPLDLLLHLIREHQLNILDIPIATITEEYLRYLALMQELDLDVAGEFLLMAATLIHIKSKMLLPAEEAGEDEEDEEADPRAALVDRLLEYKKFKEAAQTLGLLETEQALLHRRGAPALELEVEGPLSVSLIELLRAFRDVLRRAEAPAPLEITPEELNVGQRIVVLLDRLTAESPLEFTSLFAGSVRRAEIIVTFLALLELLRRRLATARQAESMGPIMIYRGVERVEEQPAEEAGGWGVGKHGSVHASGLPGLLAWPERMEGKPVSAELDRRGVLEALLFVAEEPLPLAKLQEVLADEEPSATEASVRELALSLDREGRGLMVQEVAGGFRLATRPEAHAWIQRLQQVKPARLSRAALETLAIIAYKQPITRAEIEAIRGVSVDGVMRTLLERGLIRMLGRKADAGRPILYGTGNTFLEHFGFNDLGDLPSLREIDELIGTSGAEPASPTINAPAEASPPVPSPSGDGADHTAEGHESP